MLRLIALTNTVCQKIFNDFLNRRMLAEFPGADMRIPRQTGLFSENLMNRERRGICEIVDRTE